MIVDPFVVKDIRVEGLQRTEPGTVFNYLPVKVGDTFSDDNNCGNCNNQCIGTTCQNGSCQ